MKELATTALPPHGIEGDAQQQSSIVGQRRGQCAADVDEAYEAPP